WPHARVRLDPQRLGRRALAVLADDLARRPSADRDRFATADGRCRLPAGDALRLALIDALDAAGGGDVRAVEAAIETLAGCFSNDNTAPETASLYVQDGSDGRAVAAEAALRHLLVQLLTAWVNAAWGVRDEGQRLSVFAHPTPTVELRRLGDALSPDDFREALLNPCLGWPSGPSKAAYMHLCHRVLGQHPARAEDALAAAGCAPARDADRRAAARAAQVSLVHNGLHLSLGSRRLSAAGAPEAAVARVLAASVPEVEAFLPLFVGTFSAAPRALAPEDCTPLRRLAHAAHAIDADGLRGLWQGWSRRSDGRRSWRMRLGFGRRAAPALLRDARLLDFPVALAARDGISAFDGRVDGDVRLAQTLDNAGIFDRRMSLYLPLKLRLRSRHGFAGLEGRMHSLCPRFADLAQLAQLQRLLQAHAMRMTAETAGAGDAQARLRRRLTPAAERARRLPMLAAALGAEHFVIDAATDDPAVDAALRRTIGARRLADGRLRVPTEAYRLALLGHLADAGRATVAALGADDTLRDLRQRLEAPDTESADGQLRAALRGELGGRIDDPAMFQAQLDAHCRGPLRRMQTLEAIGRVRTLVAQQRRAGAPAPPSLDVQLDQIARALRAGDPLDVPLPVPHLAALIDGLVGVARRAGGAEVSAAAQPAVVPSSASAAAFLPAQRARSAARLRRSA
ncbi:MAG: hypothetical protein AAF772_16285, partial [Acidobacteriota bacterium]